MPNVVKIDEVNAIEEQSDTGFKYHLPSLIENQTLLDTERMWQKRIRLFIRAEKRLQTMNRLRKLTAVLTVASIAMLIFSMYMAPTLTPAVFIGLFVTMVIGVASYPAWLLLSSDSQKRRDAISRMFYQSNHELDVEEGNVTLINRSNYANVTHVHVMDSQLGQFASS